MGTMQGVYYDLMVCSTSVGFYEFGMAGERFEIRLKLGKLQIGNVGNAPGGAGKSHSWGILKRKKKPTQFKDIEVEKVYVVSTINLKLMLSQSPLLRPNLRLLRSKMRRTANISKGSLGRLSTQFLYLILRLYNIYCS